MTPYKPFSHYRLSNLTSIYVLRLRLFY